MITEIKKLLQELLKQDNRLWDKDKKELSQTTLIDLLEKYDEKIIDILLQNEKTRDTFFLKVKEAYVFKLNEFRFFMEENQINNSFTQFKNKIGLSDGKRFLKDTNDIVLNWPYKDCILEGGQSTEEGQDTYYEYDEKVDEYELKKSKRKEIFFNEVLAKDEIDRLLDPKAFVNWKRYNKEGDQKVGKIKRDENGTIKENLIIKGNNLIALHSIEKQFAGKVKLIYIDPPYNTGNDSFQYNDNFNESTWLTFMKNRLKVAHNLLNKSGAIFVQIDHHQLGNLIILLNEIFGKNNKVQVISIKAASPAGFKTVNPGPIDVTEYILFYTKDKSNYKFKKGYVPVNYNRNYNLFLEKYTDLNKWEFTPIRKKVLQESGFSTEKEAREKYGKLWKSISKVMIEDFAYNNSENIVSIRDPHKPTEKLKILMQQSKNENKVREYKRENGSLMYIYKGGALAFYSKKMRLIDGKKQITELLTDFWDHISWAGIANEGQVKLKNGKKPEKLLKQILELTTEINDIVLDFHVGSGTTAAVAHKMGRQYIGIEQMDYIKAITVKRLKTVIDGEQKGISKAVEWNGGSEFIYCEIAEWNEKAKKELLKCNSLDELVNSFDDLSEKYFLHYNVKTIEFKDKIVKEKEFITLSLDEQKSMFVSMLDNNHLYINKSEMEDKQYGLSDEDIKLTKEFYGDSL